MLRVRQPGRVRPAPRRDEPTLTRALSDRERVVALQRTAGNRAVLRALRGGSVGRAGTVMIQRYRTSAAESLTTVLERVRARWHEYAYWRQQEVAKQAKGSTATATGTEVAAPGTDVADPGTEAPEEEEGPSTFEVLMQDIRGLMHLQEQPQPGGDETTAPPEEKAAPPLLKTALQQFPPAAAARHGWEIQCRNPAGEPVRLSPQEAEAHKDEPRWSMGLIYYGSGISKEGPSNFRIGINVQPSQTPAVAALLLPLLDLPYVAQFKTYVPEDAGGVLDNTIVYYHEEDTKERPNTKSLATRLHTAGLQKFTQEEHSGLMEPLAGIAGAAFAVHEAGTAYSQVRSHQIASALWSMLESESDGVPELEAMMKVLEEFGLQPRSPHLAPLSFPDDTA